MLGRIVDKNDRRIVDENYPNGSLALQEANNKIEDKIFLIEQIEQKIEALELRKSTFKEVIMLNLKDSSIKNSPTSTYSYQLSIDEKSVFQSTTTQKNRPSWAKDSIRIMASDIAAKYTVTMFRDAQLVDKFDLSLKNMRNLQKTS